VFIQKPVLRLNLRWVRSFFRGFGDGPGRSSLLLAGVESLHQSARPVPPRVAAAPWVCREQKPHWTCASAPPSPPAHAMRAHQASARGWVAGLAVSAGLVGAQGRARDVPRTPPTLPLRRALAAPRHHPRTAPWGRTAFAPWLNPPHTPPRCSMPTRTARREQQQQQQQPTAAALGRPSLAPTRRPAESAPSPRRGRPPPSEEQRLPRAARGRLRCVGSLQRAQTVAELGSAREPGEGNFLVGGHAPPPFGLNPERGHGLGQPGGGRVHKQRAHRRNLGHTIQCMTSSRKKT